MKHRKSDILWKVVLPVVLPDLLRFIYPDADEIYDMERGFDYLDKELEELDAQPEEEKDTRFADKLVKVYHRDGVEEWVLLHIEIQHDTSKKEAFPERMYNYFYRIRDRHPGVLVSALAIFTGQDGQRMPGRYTYEYRGTRLVYEYTTMSILDYSPEELDNSSNMFAHVVVAAQIRLKEGVVTEDELLNIKLLAAKRLQEKGFDEKTTNALFSFLNNYVLFEKPETYRKFEEEYKPFDKFKVMDTQEFLTAKGIEIGMERSAATFVENLLKESNFTIEKIASLANVTVDFVKEIKSKLNGSL